MIIRTSSQKNPNEGTKNLTLQATTDDERMESLFPLQFSNCQFWRAPNWKHTDTLKPLMHNQANIPSKKFILGSSTLCSHATIPSHMHRPPEFDNSRPQNMGYKIL